MGQIRIKDTATLSKRFVSRAQQSTAEYSDGVKAGAGTWEGNTKASEDNWAIGTQAAIADKRFGKGVNNAGAAKYLSRATTLGSQRFGPGVAAAEGDWSRGVQPFFDGMKSLQLPPRRPKGDPANYQIAQLVAMRNREIKLGK